VKYCQFFHKIGNEIILYMVRYIGLGFIITKKPADYNII